MEEPTKQLRENLEKITRTGKNLLELVELIKTSEISKRERETFIHILRTVEVGVSQVRMNNPKVPFTVAIMGTRKSSYNMEVLFKIREILERDNIQLITSFEQSSAMVNMRSEDFPLPSRRRVSDPFPLINELVPEPSQERFFLSPPEKHIPIKGKSSKKGKNNNFGSKFHR